MPTERQLFLKHVAQTSDFPLMLDIDRAEGIYLYDKDGKAYIDLISGIGVSNVGHRHPKVLEAIKNQLEKYLHVMVYGEYIQTPQVKLAEKLISTLPANFQSVYFVNSGSEAIEGALKLAKRYTLRPNIVSFKNAYHGSTHAALSASSDEEFKRKFRPMVPGFSHLNFGDHSGLEKIDHNTAAVLIETVQGEAGVRTADQNYFSKLRKKCSETGALLILDEIQCGFGRTGKFWAFQHYRIVPDIVVSAKGMGGGMPIGSFASTLEIMSVLKNDPVLGHITTFGGHPVSCASALATIEILQQGDLISSVEDKAKLFRELLVHPSIKEIRNQGLMMAVEFASFEKLQDIIKNLLELGVVTDWFLFCDNSMRIAPPLTITKDEIKKACSLVLQALDNS